MRTRTRRSSAALRTRWPRWRPSWPSRRPRASLISSVTS
ncbi:Corticotropin-releasing factor receptor 2 [Frankliniella fusca]|uniref:Corticotropin-releasing factor receptor 2 n=1 Tax=Frankliniella fusca TaxID=407009 RepID=A0AAE1LDB3_9NEOP|nr:Corticotropin-releasing factor receptor 2 [Frankliniella fusca]